MKIRPTGIPIEPLPPKVREVQKTDDQSEVRVEFSQAARLLATGHADDRVDMEKVNRIREQLEAGTYEIDNQALAKALIEKELQWKPGTGK